MPWARYLDLFPALLGMGFLDFYRAGFEATSLSMNPSNWIRTMEPPWGAKTGTVPTVWITSAS